MAAVLQTLRVGKAVMRPEFAAFDAELMAAAHGLGVVRAASFAQAADSAEFIALIAVAAAFAEMILKTDILGAASVPAVFAAVFAQMAVIT